MGQLQAWLRLDQAQTPEHIQTYLRQQWAINYISKRCQRLKSKAKTGLPVNQRQNPANFDGLKNAGRLSQATR